MATKFTEGQSLESIRTESSTVSVNIYGSVGNHFYYVKVLAVGTLDFYYDFYLRSLIYSNQGDKGTPITRD